jgi:hypothetical protein
MGTDQPTAEEQRESEVRLMERSLEWPYYRLPLKRVASHGFYELGFLVLLHGPLVYRGNYYRRAVPLTDLEQTKYQSYWAIYDDGWRVD